MTDQSHDTLHPSQSATAQRLKIGTRGSPLALAQAYAVRDALVAAHPSLTENTVEIEIFTTKGDRILDRALGEVGGKGLFTQEIEEALLEGRIDLAVHSMKDMPTVLPDGLTIGAVLPREAPGDVLLSRHPGGLAGLPTGAVVGTASLRRQAQIQAARPDVSVITFRGNVNTRLKKLEAGEVDATLLAAAGLNRLGFALNGLASSVEPLSHDVCLPATAQGVVGIECRAADEKTMATLSAIHDADAFTVMQAERAALAQLDGSCRTPIGAHAVLAGDRLSLTVEVLTVDGADRVRQSAEGTATAAADLGSRLGSQVKAAGAHILATFKT